MTPETGNIKSFVQRMPYLILYAPKFPKGDFCYKQFKQMLAAFVLFLGVGVKKLLINQSRYLIHLISFSFFILGSITMRGANPTYAPRFFSLQQVVDMALKQSPSSKNAVNQRENSFWQYRNFNASFRPSLYLNGNLPDFRSINTPVTQPDGSVVFQNINLSQSSARLSLNQVIAATGTTIFAASDLMRIDDFERHSVAYNSSPLIIGFEQPIFGFNDKRWSKKIEPLRYEESQKVFDERMEEISYTATILFFNLLNIQTDVELAQSNLKNSQSNLEIAKVKKKLGKISDNDYERINLSVF